MNCQLEAIRRMTATGAKPGGPVSNHIGVMADVREKNRVFQTTLLAIFRQNGINSEDSSHLPIWSTVEWQVAGLSLIGRTCSGCVRIGMGNLSSLSKTDLLAALTGDPEALDVHLSMVERDILIDGCGVKIHCHCLAVDGNGRVQPRRLAEFMRNAVADYAIPRSQLDKAKDRDLKYNSTEAVAALVEQARRSFTDLAKTGEGGEMLLFLLAERFLKIPQILCKMDLKTDSRMHYHGADGVYAGVTTEGTLKLYWGESKVYKDANAAIRDCLASLAPFIIEPEHEDAERERDLMLLSDKADLSHAELTEALKRYFDKNSIMSKRVKYCGVALVGFDAPFYPSDDAKAVAAGLAEAARSELSIWKTKIGERLKAEKLEQFEIEFFCLPLPSAEAFRAAFLTAMGLSK